MASLQRPARTCETTGNTTLTYQVTDADAGLTIVLRVVGGASPMFANRTVDARSAVVGRARRRGTRRRPAGGRRAPPTLVVTTEDRPAPCVWAGS